MRRGWIWDGVVEEITYYDDYRWQITVRAPDRRDVDYTFLIEESIQHGDGTAGVNFVLEITDHDGRALGGIKPYNYTENAWADVSDPDAVSTRFAFVTGDPSEFAAALPETAAKRARHRFVQHATEPHGRCTGRICVEHKYDKRVESCKTRSYREKQARRDSGENDESRVVCKSGLTGWQCRLRDNYDDFEEFEAYSETYSIAEKLGFESPEDAWEANPLIQGSTNPSDLCVVRPLKTAAKRGPRNRSAGKRRR